MRSKLLVCVLGLSSPCAAGSWVLVDGREPVVSFYDFEDGTIEDGSGTVIGSADADGFDIGTYAGNRLMGERVGAWRVSDGKVYDVFSHTEWGRYQETLSFFWVGGFATGGLLAAMMGYVFLRKGVSL